MSKIKLPKKAKLVISFFLQNRENGEEIIWNLQNIFGPIDILSPWFLFDHTSYYEKEMSAPLYRRVLAFKYLIRQTDLVGFKLKAVNLERMYSVSGKRLVNIDPGYVLSERFVLATGKNYAHRICIGFGVYADLTLIYKAGEFKVLPWTYPDYAENPLKKFLSLVRNKYLIDIKAS